MAINVLRASDPEQGGEGVRVTNMELFFDLVYVFAITQLSELLYDHRHQSARGALEALVLFVAVWWAWNYTAWATNWIDPERGPAMLVMILLMALGLVMAAALPEAFSARGAPFAIAYALLQVVRTGFVARAFPRGDPMRANNLRLLAWLAIGGAVWIVGAYLHGDARLAVWLGAVVLELAAPLHGFRLPGAPAIPIEHWRLTGSHLAERYQLVLMIALGESVLRVGATWAEHRHGTVAEGVAFVLGFLISASLWAAYFVGLAEQGAQRVAGAPDGGARLGRSGYAYAHAVMVAGVIVVAVAIRMTIDAPTLVASAVSTVALLGGPVLFLAGLMMFKRSAGLASGGALLVAIGTLAVLAVLAPAGADRLLLLACATAVLLALVVVVRPFLERGEPAE